MWGMRQVGHEGVDSEGLQGDLFSKKRGEYSVKHDVVIIQSRKTRL